MALPDFKSKVDCLLNVAIPTFGQQVRYLPKDPKRGPYRIQAVFDRESLFVDPDTETVVATNEPRVGVNLNHMHETPVQGDRIEIVNHMTDEIEMFTVTDSQEDGQGGAALTVQRLDGNELTTETN